MSWTPISGLRPQNSINGCDTNDNKDTTREINQQPDVWGLFHQEANILPLLPSNEEMKVQIINRVSLFLPLKESESEVGQSCLILCDLILCDLMDCSLPGSSVHGIF